MINAAVDIHPDLPPSIARSRASECLPAMLGAGARMEVYPLVDERSVLRVPRRTEQQLIEEHGSSGRKALAAGHQVSTVTEVELKDLEAIEGFIGAFVPDTAPFADLDLEGNFRYYSLQRRVQVQGDLRSCTAPLERGSSRKSLERFIRDVREMANDLGILPDLLGKGNLVLDWSFRVKLVDINNFRRLYSDEELEQYLPDADDLREFALGQKDIRKHLPPDFVDDLGHPVGDFSLAQLHNLEIRGLGRDLRAVDQDPFYAPLFNERRQRLLTVLRTDMNVA